VITTLATHNYLARLAELGTLDLLSKHAAPARPLLGLVGTTSADSPIDCYTVPAAMLERSLGNPGNGCIQHGNWLPYLPVVDDDAIVICIDGDVKMQRPFNDSEWRWLQGWQHGWVGIGPNEPKQGGDSMGNELCRIAPLLSDAETLAHFGQEHGDPIGNAGCIVATRRTWVKLWMAYLRRWLDTAPLFAHIAVQQWTLNLCINEGFERVVLPQSFHTHGHWGEMGPPAGGWGLTNTATWEGEPILFAHKTW
jgi:hypothetical protein